MRIIEQTTCAHLGRAKPATTNAVYVTEHTRSFNCFISTDVWTADGWLVTAVQDNGIHHLRKGDQRCTAEVGPNEILHYNPTPRSQYFGFGVAKAWTPQEDARIEVSHYAGIPDTQIAAELGRSPAEVTARRTQLATK